MPTFKYKKTSLGFINVTMKNINNLTDDIYECLVDGDYQELNIKIKEINYILRDLKKTTENELK